MISYIPSPHHSSRGSNKISLVVIHYTGSTNMGGTLTWFQDKKSKVSAHYVVGLDGSIVQMVPLERSAWHAGKSSYMGKKNCNKFSVGIELVGNSSTDFTDAQYDAIGIIVREVAKYAPDFKWDTDIAGHQHIAPGRKVDPGRKFDWKKMWANIDDKMGVTDLYESVENEKMEPGKDPSILEFIKRYF